MVIPSHLYIDMHIYTTHPLKLGMDQRERERVVIPSHLYIDMYIYTTHRLKLGMDQRKKEKEGVVIRPIHLYI